MGRSSGDNPTIGTILDSIHESGQSKLSSLQQEWEEMDEATFVANGRKLAYGVVLPALASSDASPEVIDEVTALFESNFKAVESGIRSGAGGRRSSSSR